VDVVCSMRSRERIQWHTYTFLQIVLETVKARLFAGARM